MRRCGVATDQIPLEILISGPARAGKSAALRRLFSPPGAAPGRLPLHGIRLRVHAHAALGAELDRCRGLLFIADARPARLEANFLSFERTEDDLRRSGLDPRELPRVILINHSDAADSIEAARLAALLDEQAPFVAGVAHRGVGIEDALRDLYRRCAPRPFGGPPLLSPARYQLAACDQSWAALEGRGADERRCRRCRRAVRRASTTAQVIEAARLGSSVAITDPRLIDRRCIELRAQRLPRLGPWPCFIEHGFAV